MNKASGSVPVRAVLFDAVGTLIRPYPSVGTVYAGAAADLGFPCSAGALGRAFPGAYHELGNKRFACGADFRTSETRERHWWREVVALTFERAGYGIPPPEVTAAAFEAFAAGGAWKIYADARRALDGLVRQSVPVGIVSNFDSRLRRILSELGLDRHFRVVLISSEYGRAKPSPAIFLAAAGKLGLRPGETLHVGDHLEEDFHAPRSAGLQSLLIMRKGPRREGTIAGLDRLLTMI